jgi:hypothetical protein
MVAKRRNTAVPACLMCKLQTNSPNSYVFSSPFLLSNFYEWNILYHSLGLSPFAARILSPSCCMPAPVDHFDVRQEDSSDGFESDTGDIQRTQTVGNAQCFRCCGLARKEASQCLPSIVSSCHDEESNCGKLVPPTHWSTSLFRHAVNMGHAIPSIVGSDARPGTS